MFKEHPRGLFMLFFSELWERFSFYGMRALLTLYLTLQLFEHLGDAQARVVAVGIYAAYGALVYATPFIGGLIADKILGYQKAVMLGAVLMAVGHFVMAIETEFFLYIALAFLIVGNGFFKPNISSMVGGLYEENDPRRDGGFTIFYMGINIGAAIAPLLCGWLGQTYGWSYGFGLAGIGMIAGLIVFGSGKSKLEDNGLPPHPEKLKRNLFAGLTLEYFVYILAFLSVILFAFLVKNYQLMTFVLTPFAVLVFLIIFIYSLKSEKVVRERLWVVLILIFFSILFWAFFEQAGSSITLFTQESVDRNVFGWLIPASVFQTVNPTFIILLAPLFSKMWINLGRKGKEPNTPIKFALGIIQLGIGFLIFTFGASFMGVDAAGLVTVPLIFLVLGYLLHTTGELCLSPVGLSMITKLSPKTITAMVMGAWFLSSAMAHHIGGVIAALTGGADIGENQIGRLAVDSGLIAAQEMERLSEMTLGSYDRLANYLTVFEPVGWVAIGAGVFLLALSPILKKWMHGVH